MFGLVPNTPIREPAPGGGYWAWLLADARLGMQRNPPIEIGVAEGQGHVPGDAGLVDERSDVVRNDLADQPSHFPARRAAKVTYARAEGSSYVRRVRT
jgi:hypothetical protein